MGIQQQGASTTDIFGGNEGKLVRDIVATKEALEDKAEEEEEENKEQGIILGRGRKKEGTKKEDVAKLREAVQLLCQSTNPLAKCMDQLQEDIENMHKEITQWSSERRKYSSLLKAEQKITDDELTKVGNLTELEEEAKTCNDKINSIKAEILRNDDVIEKLLNMVVQGSGK